MPVITEVAGALWWLQPEYYQELVGMGSSLGVDPKSLLVAQYAYEFSAFCTSVIAHDSEGQIIHSRNLDFAFAGPMRNITYEAVFMRRSFVSLISLRSRSCSLITLASRCDMRRRVCCKLRSSGTHGSV